MIYEKHREPNDFQKKIIDFDYVKKLGHYSNEPITSSNIIAKYLYVRYLCRIYNLLFRSTLCLL
jgi:hypothetical protein